MLHEEDSVDSPLSIHLHPTELLSSEERYYYESLSDDDQYLYNQSRIKRYYYHRDHQNSIIALSDHNAQIVEYYEYDIYGNITKSEHTEGIKTLNPYRYTGREIDSGDLYYYRARYYDPTIGRFITPDPIGFLGGDTNFYRYVGNDPLNHIDPTGLSKCDTQEKKHKQSSEKLKDKKSFKWKKVLKSGAKKVGGGALFFIDGPIPIGDIFGAALLASDFADGVQAAQEIAEATTDLADTAEELNKCHKQEESQKNSGKRDDGVGVAGKEAKKTRRKCGERGKHKDAGNETAEERNSKPKSERMDSDHIPSQEHVKRDMDKRFRKDNYSKDEMDCMKKFVSENMETIMLPNDIHSGEGAKTGQTQPNTNAYKGWADDFKTKNGRDPSLHEIAKSETDIIEKEIDKKGRSNDPCGKKIKEGLDFFKNLDKDYFTNLYDKAIKNIDDCLNKKKK